MTATEDTVWEVILYRFLPTFDGNIRVLTIAYKQKWPFPMGFAKLYSFFWLDFIKFLTFLADNILSSPSTQRNTNHPCN